MFSHSVMSDSAILWTVACQPTVCMGFSRQEYYNVVPFTTPGDLYNTGIEPTSPVSPALQADSSGLSYQTNTQCTIFSRQLCYACLKL